MLRRVRHLHWILCLALSARAGLALEVTPASPVPPYTLIRVKLEAGERAWVLGADLLPVDVARTETGLVFTGKPGRYAILAFTDATQDQRLVEIRKSDTPDPPSPPDPPDPPPPPPHPVPNDLIQKYGIGLVAWEQATSVSRPAEARTLSLAFYAAANSLQEHRITVAGALGYVRSVRETLSSDWIKWERAVEPLLSKAAVQGQTTLHYRNYFYEIAKALEIAGRVMTSKPGT